MKRHSIQTFPWRPGLRAFTLNETMIAVFISSLIAAALMSLLYISTRSFKEMSGQTRMRSARMIALDQIRYRLVDAKIGTCTVTDSGHRIEFIDPNLGGGTSAFYFVSDSRSLFYDQDLSDGQAAVEVAKGPINIAFELQSAGAMVKLEVKSSVEMAYADVDEQDGETAVYLRNE